MKVVKNYIWFLAVHSFDVETFEFSVPAEFVLMNWSVYVQVVNKQFQNRELSKLTGPQ